MGLPVASLENLTASSWTGWHRITVHERPAWDAARVGTRTVVVGQPVGRIGWGLDVQGTIGGGQRVSLDLSTAQPIEHYALHPDPDAVSDPVGFFGIPTVWGIPLIFKGMEPDGACYLIHFGGRIGAFYADLWLRCYPGQTRYNGTFRLTCSDVSTPTLFAELPAGLLGLPAGMRFADGQSVLLPVQWQRDTRRLILQPVQIVGRGVATVGWLGIPSAGGFNLDRWLADRHQQAADALTSWRLIATGITPNGAVAGDQEDQGFGQGFESFYGGTLKGIATRWLAAMQWAKRPCHHLHASGAIVDPEAVGAVYWNGRPWSLSRNKFGKPRELAEWDCSGWYGPDLEHHLIHTLAAAYELTQDPGLANELTHLAHVYLGSETLDPALSTTTQFVSRALGWNSLVAAHLYRLLPDRTLAERVKARWLVRVELHRQRWGLGLWDTRITPPESMWVRPADSPRYWMTWQQAVGAFGVYAASDVLGAPTAVKAWAAAAAASVVEFAYDAQDLEWDALGVRDNAPLTSYQQSVTAHRSGFYRNAWLPLAVWVVRESQPTNAKARRLWDRMNREANEDATAWYRVCDWVPAVRGA